MTDDTTTPDLDPEGPGEPVAPVAEPETPEQAPEPEQAPDEDEEPDEAEEPADDEVWLPGSGSHVFSEATADQFPDDPRL